MDQFDDLPDIIDKDNKPKFVTEVSFKGNADSNDGVNGPYNNGL